MGDLWGGVIIFGLFFLFWPAGHGLGGVRGCGELAKRGGGGDGGVLEAQVFTHKWASKQDTVGSNMPY